LSDFEGEERKDMRKAIIGDDVSAVALAEADGIDTLIKKSYKLLGLATYFTTGEKETRAWTIKAGSTAPVAAAAIHTDFEKKFIRAEVVFWSDLLESGSMVTAKSIR
jgi:ribosome-binding ATPase YchF (GTP1/OBG family)